MQRTPSLFSLDGKIILLTGGLGLIGKSFIQSLTEFGATVLVLDLVSETEAIQLLSKFLSTEQYKYVKYYQADITDKDALLSVRKKILKVYKKIDCLINNAALNPKVEKGNVAVSSNYSFETMPLELWQKEIAVNLTGTMLCCQVFGSKMIAGGSIVNVASIYGIVAPDQSIYPTGFSKPPAYGVTKAGVINLSKYLASYWGEKNIRVNAVVFGGVENNQDMKFIRNYIARTPLKRMAHVSDFSGILLFLCSDASEYATGATFRIDGGWTAI